MKLTSEQKRANAVARSLTALKTRATKAQDDYQCALDYYRERARDGSAHAADVIRKHEEKVYRSECAQNGSTP